MFALFRGLWTIFWKSHIAGKGVTRMAFDGLVFDSGDVQPLTAKGRVVYHSFSVKRSPSLKFRLYILDTA